MTEIISHIIDLRNNVQAMFISRARKFRNSGENLRVHYIAETLILKVKMTQKFINL